MSGKIIDEDILKQLTEKLLQIIADNVYIEEEYDDDSINSLFDVESPEKLAYYESLINPDIVSENRLWSSKTIADKIAESIVESNAYSDSLITNIASIQLEWCETSLPTTGESNKIYILPVTSGSDTVNTLNIWNATTSAYVTIGNLEIDLSQYYTSSQVDTKLADKANKSEVLAADKVLVSLGSEGTDSVYSSKLTKDELDKKVNVSDISTIIDENSTDDTIPTSKAIYDTINDLKTNFQDGVNTIYDAVVAKGVTPVDNSPSSIAEAIAKLGASVYIENLIPTMTSNTSPSGLAFADNELISSYGYYAWRAFDGKTDINPGSNQYNLWASNNTSNAFIGYKFDTPTMVTSLSFVGRYESDANTKQSPKTVKVQYSDDNSTWYDATDVINIEAQTVGVMRTDKINIDNSSYHLYWRLFILTIYGGTATTVIEMQMSGYK